MTRIGNCREYSYNTIRVRALGQDPAEVWDAEMMFICLRDVIGPQTVDRDKQNRLVRLSEYRRGDEEEAKRECGFRHTP
jgi:hypothetical protein